MVGPALNRVGLVLPVMLKVSVWPASSGGPALMAVAQGLTVCAPASSFTVWLAPAVKLGASLTLLTVTVMVWVALVLTPPLLVSPLSCKRKVSTALPLVLAAGV